MREIFLMLSGVQLENSKPVIPIVMSGIGHDVHVISYVPIEYIKPVLRSRRCKNTTSWTYERAPEGIRKLFFKHISSKTITSMAMCALNNRSRPWEVHFYRDVLTLIEENL